MQKETRRLSGTLLPKNRLVESALASGNFDEATITSATRFGNSLLRARDAWADKYRHGRRYSDRETAQRNSLIKGVRHD